MAGDETQNEFKLKFAGEPGTIDAATLGYSLVNVTAIIQEINQTLSPTRPIEIRVKAHGEGSFLVHLALMSPDIGQLLTAENLKLIGAATGAIGATAGAIVAVVAGVFKIRKLLKGKPPKEIQHNPDGGVTVIGDNNTTLIIDEPTYQAYFGNPRVSEALSKTFKTLDSDPEVDGFEILDDVGQQLFEAPRDEFSGMALKGDLPLPQARSIIQPASVYIVKPSFERNLKWDVVIYGNRVPVTMKDEKFLSQIDSGISRFGKGDTLDVELQIDQVYDPELMVYLNRAYQINKVQASPKA
jgi:hypothetical protein